MTRREGDGRNAETHYPVTLGVRVVQVVIRLLAVAQSVQPTIPSGT